MEKLSDEQKKAHFDSSPKERQMEILNSVNDQLFQVLSTKMGVLPTISALSATMLVVATFNEKLLTLDTEVKAVISILILLVPISLIFYIKIITRAENTAYKLNEIYTGKKTVPANKTDRFFIRYQWVLQY